MMISSIAAAAAPHQEPATKATALQPLIERVYTGHCNRDKSAIKSALTAPRVMDHCTGAARYGVYPIAPGESTTRVALFDLDSHKGEVPPQKMDEVALRLERALAMDFGMQANLFRSSGGKGIHLILLWDEPQDAYSVREMMAEALAEISMRNGTKGVVHGEIEIFPKQTSVPADGWGNMFVLPFAGESRPLRVVRRLAAPAAGNVVEMPARTLEPIEAAAFSWAISPPVEVQVRPEPKTPKVVESVAGHKLIEMLSYIPNAHLDYEGDYMTVLPALHHAAGGSEEGLAIAETWCSKNPANNPETNRKRWESFGKRSEGPMITVNSLKALARKHGWQEDFSDRFDNLPEPTDAESAAEEAAGIAKLAALHATTDLKNAERLYKHFGKGLLSARGQWYSWTGTHWHAAASEEFRKACKLSAIIKDEALDVIARVSSTASDEERASAEKLSDTLRKWAHKSESAATIDAALKVLKRFVTPDRDLDSDRWLLNVANGTIDLRTGKLQPHDRADLITKFVDVAYHPEARAPRFEAFLADIMPDDPTVKFMQRWLGYCATGDVTEQKFAVHWGTGGNGKSTLIEAVEGVLGQYSIRVTDDLMTGSGSVKEYTIAGLAGCRMATASESEEGAPLREATIKNVTGDALLTGRFLYKDQFTFAATHKLQLLTNNKPVIKGQDRGIWRRVLLIPYRASFGTAEDVKQGKADRVGDPKLAAALAKEREGILAWVVAGAREWREKGLRPPATVTAAVEDYQGEQDRIGHFLEERCVLGQDFTVSLLTPDTVGQQGLYPQYQEWARECGFVSVNRQRFAQLVEAKVPHYRKETKKITVAEGRRTVTLIHGLKLQEEVLS